MFIIKNREIIAEKTNILYSAGGVIVSALNGRIRLDNTLESRLDLLSEIVCI